MRRTFGTPVVDYLPALGLLIVTAVYLAVAYGYSPVSRAVPVAVGWAVIVLVGLDLASRTQTRFGRSLTRWLNPAADPVQTATQPHYSASKQIAAILWIVGFTAALVLIGVLYAVPLYIFASMRLRGRRPYLACVAVCAGTTLFVWLMFSVVLRLELYPGILFGGR